MPYEDCRGVGHTRCQGDWYVHHIFIIFIIIINIIANYTNVPYLTDCAFFILHSHTTSYTPINCITIIISAQEPTMIQMEVTFPSRLLRHYLKGNDLYNVNSLYIRHFGKVCECMGVIVPLLRGCFSSKTL